ncbi:epoxide hydrolase family protein [Pseudoxanthomonas beigongshangi]|uniref:epoxide hydrolase family protein n=1 Tax=Pseudoxanthomonas beigongshangi TaxID=2782537 RepID=UPI00193BB9AD|nr:epoxide hydrolase [Pseudoxanthomonas beigongshangi]
MSLSDARFPVDLERRRLLGSAAAAAAGAGLLALLPSAAVRAATSLGDDRIRPFRAQVSEQDLADLRRRVRATRWPDRETVADTSQGLPLATLRTLVDYWGGDYDWRRLETRINRLPQFITRIDGVDIHFIHVRSRHADALPVILTHGWPGSFLEFLGAIDPLTNPTAHGGRAEDAFDVVIPSIPGYGFSSRPDTTGWGPERVGRAWDELMRRLGYHHYVSQGGDHGSVISDAMGRQPPPGLRGIHLTMPATVPGDLMAAINAGAAPPAGLAADEREAFQALSAFFGRNAAYGAMMVTRPQTIGYALNDSPVGLAAWMYDKIAQWTDSDGQPERVLGRDAILDDISLYWLTGTATSAGRFYWENNNNNFSATAQKTDRITVPVAVSVFPGEIYRAPRSWTERAYPSLYYFNSLDKGGHFAAWEQPQLFSAELRAAFRPLRKTL